MWLTRAAINRPVTITMVVMAFVVLGLSSLARLPIDLYPDIEFPWVVVIAVYPGAGPEEIETLITRPIEDAVSTISGVKNVNSSSEEGVSSVAVEFQLGVNLDTAASEVREKVDAAGFRLPRDMEPPVIQKFSMSAIPVVQFSLSSPRPAQELRRLADDVVRDRLSRLSGVGSVEIWGGDVREILVAVNQGRAEAHGVGLEQIVQTLQAANLNLPSGVIEESRREYAVRAVGEFESVADIREVQLRTPAGRPVALGEIAEVLDTVAERRDWARVDGEDSVTVTVLKRADANTVAVADGVRAELYRLTGQTFDERGYEVVGRPRAENWRQALWHRVRPPRPVERARGLLPQDVTARITLDQSTFIRDALNDLRSQIVMGVILAVLVVFLFLHNFRGTMIVALAIPTSIIAALTPVFFAGFSLNMMTMLALAVTVGILVDDSIVIIENIYRHLKLGEPPKEAAFNGRTEIGLAAIAITLVDVVVYIPVAFMGGIVGMFFRQFGITVAVTSLISLFVAFTMTPMLASRWYREEDARTEGEGARQGAAARLMVAFDRSFAVLRDAYSRLLNWALDHRLAALLTGAIALLAVIGVAVPSRMVLPTGDALPGKAAFQALIAAMAVLGLLAGGRGARPAMAVAGAGALLVVGLLYRPLPMEFFPRVDRGQVMVSVELPAGSSLEATEQVVRQLEAIALDRERFPEVDSVVASVGRGVGGVFGGGGTGALYGGLRVVLVDKLDRDRSDLDIVAELDRLAQQIPGAQISVTSYQGMGGGAAAPISAELTGEDMDELLRVAEEVRRRMAEVPGVVNADVTWRVGKPELRARVDPYRAADRGMTTYQVARVLRAALEGDTTAKLREGANQYDIRVRLREEDREGLRSVENVLVGWGSGPVYAGDVAELTPGTGPTKLDRKNRQRMVAVQADLAKGYGIQNVVTAIERELAGLDMGGVTLHFGGEAEMFREGMGDTLLALMLSIVLIYILLAALFEGYLSPLIIMLGLPMALVGALLAILATGNSFSLVVMIGIIMLVGIVAKNSILLVDYTNTLRARGMGMMDALREACPTRLRPVLMTALTTIFALLPVAVGTSRGGEFRAPMAIAVIGGLSLSMFLSLVIIPVLYTVFDAVGATLTRGLQWVLRKAIP